MKRGSLCDPRFKQGGELYVRPMFSKGYVLNIFFVLFCFA